MISTTRLNKSNEQEQQCIEDSEADIWPALLAAVSATSRLLLSTMALSFGSRTLFVPGPSTQTC